MPLSDSFSAVAQSCGYSVEEARQMVGEEIPVVKARTRSTQDDPGICPTTRFKQRLATPQFVLTDLKT